MSLAAAVGGGGATNGAMALAALVREAVASHTERAALHLPLGRLAPQLGHGHHQRLLREALEPALRPVRGRLYELPNGDLVAVGPSEAPHLRAAAETLVTLLPPGDAAATVTLLRLPQQAAALLAAVEESLLPATRGSAPETTGAAFGTRDLAAVERVLATASLTRLLRRRHVCRLTPGGGGPEPLCDHLDIPMRPLLAALAPGTAPDAAPWLLRRLRGSVDRCLLTELARPEEVRRLGEVSLALGLDSLTDPAFLRLDAALGAARRRQVVIVVDAEDLLCDAEGFRFAREFLHIRGFRLAVAVTTPGLLRALSVAALGVDALRLSWSPGLAEQARPDVATALRALPQVSLVGADRAAAIGWAWAAGITSFESRLLHRQG